jgi:DNA-binding MarR family transcriptional regulator
MRTDLRQLHEALLDLMAFLNRPQPDRTLIEAAGIRLDRALFPLLVRIERRGPIGIVELAEAAGRDHSTVSRQVANLERAGLAVRRSGRADQRVREVAITAKGRTMTTALDAARQRLIGPLLDNWSRKERSDLVRLLRRLVDDLTSGQMAAADTKTPGSGSLIRRRRPSARP